MELPLSIGFAGDRKLSGAGAEEKDLGVLMEEKLSGSQQYLCCQPKKPPVG